MCRSRYYSREGLVRYRTEVGHSEALSTQGRMKLVEGDAGFGDDKTFVPIDLFEGGEDRKGGRKKKWALVVVVPGP